MSPAAPNLQPWQTVFDALSEAVCILDLEGRILNYNRALELLLERPAGQILGSNCCRLLHGVEKPIPNCPFTRLKESRQRETLNLTVGGRTLQVTVEPLWDEAGTLIGGIHLLADLTEQARERAGLLNRIKELEEQKADRPIPADHGLEVYRRLINGQEAENRQRYHLLSDRVGKGLAGLKLDLRTFQNKINDPRLSAPLNDCLDHIDQAWIPLQELAEAIRPPLLDDLGLIPALRREINRLTERDGTMIRMQAGSIPAVLSPEMESACFYLIRGALSLQSRQAKSLTVSIETAGDRLMLLVTAHDPDLRTAAAPEKEGDPVWAELRERIHLIGGEAAVRSIPGEGVEIFFQLPIAGRP